MINLIWHLVSFLDEVIAIVTRHFGLQYHYDYVIEQSTAIDMPYRKKRDIGIIMCCSHITMVIHIIACLPCPSILIRLTSRLRTSLAVAVFGTFARID